MEKTIGKKLIELRRNKGLSQQQVAEILNVSRQTISKWESDLSLPDIDILLKLCDYYKITINELLSINEESEDVKSIYEQLQQVLINLQKENKQKHTFNMVLICISILSLSVSLFMGNMNKKLLNDRTQDLINEVNIMARDNKHYSKFISEQNDNKIIESQMKVTYVDIEDNEVAIEFDFKLNEYNKDTKLSIKFPYGFGPNFEILKFDLNKTSENTFKLHEKIPLDDYSDVQLIIDDGHGNIKIQDVSEYCKFKKQVLTDLVNMYIPTKTNGEIDTKIIIYVPTILQADDPNVEKYTSYYIKNFEGMVNITIKNLYDEKVYFENEINLNEITDLVLNEPLPIDEYIYVQLTLEYNGESYIYSNFYNLTLDRRTAMNNRFNVFKII